VAAAVNTPILSIEGLSKTFPGCVALDRFELEVGRGEVMALVGQNGCGKSTFIKVLSGFHQPDRGFHARFAGYDFQLGDTGTAAELGIHFVHQDLGLLDDLSAVENVAFGTGFPTRPGGLIRWRDQLRRTVTALESLGYHFDVTVPVGRLSPSQRVAVAIARALSPESEHPLALLVLDEPTASMPQTEVDSLFTAVRRLRQTGVSTLFVSHRLDEVFAVADRVTVVRDGRRVAVTPVTNLTQQTLIEQILGRPAELSHIDGTRAHRGPNTAALSVRSLRGKNLRRLDLDVHSGEIVGVTGLTGSGREELALLLFGAQLPVGGSIHVDGRAVKQPSPSRAKELGVALVPANRQSAAVVPQANVRENLTLAQLHGLCRYFLVRRRAEQAEVGHWLSNMQVRPADGEASIVTLSGGNQQKVLLARWLRTDPRVLILDEPTQGVDVGTKPEIYALLRHAAASGTAVIVCSTDSEELVELTDRVIVLSDGRVKTELQGSGLTLDRLNHELVAA
jgi:ribose transport system ATP-binding protein